MFPMISTVEEIPKAKVVEEVKVELLRLRPVKFRKIAGNESIMICKEIL